MDYDLPGFFRRAKIESQKTKDMRVTIGAVISKGGKVISVGHNQKKTHPLTNTYSLHAEAAAIIGRRYHKEDLSGCSIWVYRERTSGEPGMSKPCDDCMRLIVASGIKKVYYTTNSAPFWERINI